MEPRWNFFSHQLFLGEKNFGILKNFQKFSKFQNFIFFLQNVEKVENLNKIEIFENLDIFTILKILIFFKISKIFSPKNSWCEKKFIAAPPNTLYYVSGDLPKCQGHSTRTHTAAQGRTVRVLFEKSKIFVIFHDFSLISQGPPGVPGWISDEFWKFLAENHDLWPLVSSNSSSRQYFRVSMIIIHAWGVEKKLHRTSGAC